jgi:pimeloyl-ACP methyl ester carboxylesterase
VSDDLLKERNVRLVAIDQTGYGRSDKNPKQTMASFTKDIAELADLLQLGEKFWLLGYSFGGAYTGQLHLDQRVCRGSFCTRAHCISGMVIRICLSILICRDA